MYEISEIELKRSSLIEKNWKISFLKFHKNNTLNGGQINSMIKLNYY